MTWVSTIFPLFLSVLKSTSLKHHHLANDLLLHTEFPLLSQHSTFMYYFLTNKETSSLNPNAMHPTIYNFTLHTQFSNEQWVTLRVCATTLARMPEVQFTLHTQFFLLLFAFSLPSLSLSINPKHFLVLFLSDLLYKDYVHEPPIRFDSKNFNWISDISCKG